MKTTTASYETMQSYRLRTSLLFLLPILFATTTASVTISNSTTTFDAEATGVTRFFQGSIFEEFTAQLVAFDSDLDKTDRIVLIAPVSGVNWETLVRNELNTNARGLVMFNRFWTYNPGRIELIFDGSDTSEINIPTVEIIQRLGLELYEQLKRGELITVTMRCCDNNIWTETYASFSTLMTVICAVTTAIVLGCALWKFLLFTNMLQTIRPFNLAKTLLLFIIVASLVMGVMIPLDPFWTKKILSFPAGSFFISSPVTAALTVTLLITFYWIELVKKKDTRSNTILRKFKVPYIIAIIVLWILEIVQDALRAAFLDINLMVYIGIGLSTAIAVTVAVVFLWSTGRIINKLSRSDNVAAKRKGSQRLRRSAILLMIGGLCNSFAFLIYIITFTDFYHTPYGFPMPFFIGYLFVQVSYLLQISAFVPPKNKPKSDSTTPRKSTSANEVSGAGLQAINIES